MAGSTRKAGHSVTASRRCTLFAATARYLGETRRSLTEERGWGVADGLRSFALVWIMHLHVIMFHFDYTAKRTLDSHIVGKLLMKWTENGSNGVDIFFVLSGFLLGSNTFREFERAGGIFTFRAAVKFWIRRIFRIYPALLMSIVIDILIKGDQSLCPNPKWHQNLYLLTNYQLDNMVLNNNVCLTQAWTINVEIQMYLLTPFFFMFCSMVCRLSDKCLGPRGKNPKHSSVVMFLSVLGFFVGLGVRLWVVYTDPGFHNRGYSESKTWDFYGQTHNRFSTYFLGIAAGVLCLTRPHGLWRPNPNVKVVESPSVLLLDQPNVPPYCRSPYGEITIAVLGWLFWCFFFPGDISPQPVNLLRNKWPRVHWFVGNWFAATTRPFFGVCIAYIMTVCATDVAPGLNRFFSKPCWRPLANLSYGSYLLQFAVWPYEKVIFDKVKVLGNLENFGWAYLMMLFTLFLFTFGALIAAVPMYFLVERPFMLLGARIARCVESCGQTVQRRVDGPSGTKDVENGFQEAEMAMMYATEEFPAMGIHEFGNVDTVETEVFPVMEFPIAMEGVPEVVEFPMAIEA